MFTGIIEQTGRIKKLSLHPKRGGQIFIQPTRKFLHIKQGESIAVNGCCLTVVSHKRGVLLFDVSDETVRKTTFSGSQIGDMVNLERAMRAGDRFGGHMVLGHVDGVGHVLKIHSHKGSREFVFSCPKRFSKLLIAKGSVAVDGISLTVCDLKPGSFSVYIIPHTLKNTHLDKCRVGDAVNLEFDVLGKYVLGRNRNTKPF